MMGTRRRRRDSDGRRSKSTSKSAADHRKVSKAPKKNQAGADRLALKQHHATEFILKTQDCILGMRDLPAESIDVVVTSPPYNLGIRYTNYNDRRKADEYLVWSLEWASEVRRVLKPDGSFFLNLGASPSNPLVPHELIVELKKVFVLQNTFHWIKSITIQKPDGIPNSVGHFKPLVSKRFVNDCHEYVFHLTKQGRTPIDRLAVGVPYSDKSNIARWGHTAGRDLRCRGNNWFIPYRTIVSRSRQRPHPATFPTELAVYCLKIHGSGQDLVVLDPFVGIGHAALAAKQCGADRFIGFDIDKEYVRVARNAVRAKNSDIEGPIIAEAPTPESDERRLFED